MRVRPRVLSLVASVLAVAFACSCGGGEAGPKLRSDLVCAYTDVTHDDFRCALDSVPSLPWDEAESLEPLPVDEARALMKSGQFACWHTPDNNACECDALCSRSEVGDTVLCECGYGDWTDEDTLAAPVAVDACTAEESGVCCDWGFGCMCRSDEVDCSWGYDWAEAVESCEAPQPGEPGTEFELTCVYEGGGWGPCEWPEEDTPWIWVASCDDIDWPDEPEPSDDSSTSTTGADESDSGPGGSTPDGGPCDADGDCLSGSRCLPPFAVPNGPRACGPACAEATSATDCMALTNLDYRVEVPNVSASGDGPNAWNADALSRGNVCGSEGQCQYACPPGSAVTYDAAGAPESCAWLPHFAWNAELTECVWNEAVECAFVERPDAPGPCDACNSDQLFANCNTGRFECLLLDDRLEGECVEWASEAELAACIEGGVGYDCDPTCYQQCASANCTPDFCVADGCIDLCCMPTGESPGPSTCG